MYFHFEVFYSIFAQQKDIMHRSAQYITSALFLGTIFVCLLVEYRCASPLAEHQTIPLHRASRESMYSIYHRQLSAILEPLRRKLGAQLGEIKSPFSRRRLQAGSSSASASISRAQVLVSQAQRQLGPIKLRARNDKNTNTVIANCEKNVSIIPGFVTSLKGM